MAAVNETRKAETNKAESKQPQTRQAVPEVAPKKKAGLTPHSHRARGPAPTAQFFGRVHSCLTCKPRPTSLPYIPEDFHREWDRRQQANRQTCPADRCPLLGAQLIVSEEPETDGEDRAGHGDESDFGDSEIRGLHNRV